MEEQNPAEQTEEMIPMTVYRSVRDIPPMTVFNYAKCNTAYFKMPDGSLRNLKKFIKKMEQRQGK